MSILWILEQAQQTAPRLATILMGDFAVRAFASLDSLGKLARLSGDRLPSALIIDCRSNRWSIPQINTIARSNLVSTLLVTVGSKPVDGVDAELTSAHYGPGFESLSFSRFIADSLQTAPSPTQGSVIRYRDLVLEFEKMRCSSALSKESVPLPQKEAQLLRLLLARRGQAVSRAEIQMSIWPEIKLTPRTIDSHISRLRGKLGQFEVTIVSVYGGGYILK